MGREGWTKFEKKGEGVGIIRGGLHKAGGQEPPLPTMVVTLFTGEMLLSVK